MWCQWVRCEQPLDEITVQVWLLYHYPNIKYCTSYAHMCKWDGLTNGPMDDPIIGNPGWPYQHGGIKSYSNVRLCERPQGIHMSSNMKPLSLLVLKLWPRLHFSKVGEIPRSTTPQGQNNGTCPMWRVVSQRNIRQSFQESLVWNVFGRLDKLHCKMCTVLLRTGGPKTLACKKLERPLTISKILVTLLEGNSRTIRFFFLENSKNQEPQLLQNLSNMNYIPTCTSSLDLWCNNHTKFNSMQQCRKSLEDQLKCAKILVSRAITPAKLVELELSPHLHIKTCSASLLQSIIQQ